MNLHASMEAFVEVARRGGFSPAARQLNLSTTSVSRLVGDLEAKLGVALLRRTTRKVSLTEAGSRYLSRATLVLDEIRQLNEETAGTDQVARGLIRLTIPPGTVKSMILSKVVDFAAQHPEVDVDVDITERVVDLVGEGYDLAIRVRPREDSTLIGHHIFSIEYGLFGSPDYLQRRGIPRHPKEVAAHDCVQGRGMRNDQEWIFQRDGEVVSVNTRWRLRLTDYDTRRRAALRGLGLAVLPTNALSLDLETGRLVRVLSSYRILEEEFYLVRPQTPFLPVRLRRFIDFMTDALRRPET